MLTRRQFLTVAGVSATGSAVAAYTLMNPPVEASGSSESGTICHAPVQTPPEETLNILGVQVDETTISVGYNIKSDLPVDSVAIVVDDEAVARQPWSGDNGELTFSHDGPITFEVQAHSEDGRVLDSARILAECIPAEELPGRE